MGVRLLGFLGCVTVLVLVEGSVLRAEDQVVHCAETKVKGAIELTLLLTLGRCYLRHNIEDAF